MDWNLVKLVAEQTADAYSHARYGRGEWLLCTGYVLGLPWVQNTAQAKVFLRSKHMRWAADNATKPDHPTCTDLANYVRDTRNNVGGPDLEEMLVAARRSAGCSDAAGLAEGEPFEHAGDWYVEGPGQEDTTLGPFDTAEAAAQAAQDAEDEHQNVETLQEHLHRLIDNELDACVGDEVLDCILSGPEGLDVCLKDGAQFRVTIKQTKPCDGRSL